MSPSINGERTPEEQMIKQQFDELAKKLSQEPPPTGAQHECYWLHRSVLITLVNGVAAILSSQHTLNASFALLSEQIKKEATSVGAVATHQVVSEQFLTMVAQTLRDKGLLAADTLDRATNRLRYFVLLAITLCTPISLYILKGILKEV